MNSLNGFHLRFRNNIAQFWIEICIFQWLIHQTRCHKGSSSKTRWKLYHCICLVWVRTNIATASNQFFISVYKSFYLYKYHLSRMKSEKKMKENLFSSFSVLVSIYKSKPNKIDLYHTFALWMVTFDITHPYAAQRIIIGLWSWFFFSVTTIEHVWHRIATTFVGTKKLNWSKSKEVLDSLQSFIWHFMLDVFVHRRSFIILSQMLYQITKSTLLSISICDQWMTPHSRIS